MSNSQKKTSEKLIQRLNPVAGHAMEFVAEIDGVVFINDSSSITVESTWNSLNTCPENVVLLIGGIDSRSDYSMLEELVAKKVRSVICLGTDNSRIMKAFFRTGTELTAVSSVQEALEVSRSMAKPGDVVLFSPSCPSFHPFDNYKNRGNDMKRIVLSFITKEEN